MSVYVAGSSDELHRARRVMDMYRAAGVEVVSTWVENITGVGAANPRDADRETRQGYAYGCIDQVRAADVLHWLAPGVGHGRGSYWEAALAWVWSKQIIASGDTKQSIFPALVRETMTDDDAVAQIVDAHRRARKIGGDTWSRSIGVNPNAATPITGPVLCTCLECIENRANAARVGHAVVPATFHAPTVARTTTPQVDALLGAIAEVPEAAADAFFRDRLAPVDESFTFEPTGEEGINTGRPRYRVTCNRCLACVHEGTTGPLAMAGRHVCSVDPLEDTGVTDSAPLAVEVDNETVLIVKPGGDDV